MQYGRKSMRRRNFQTASNSNRQVGPRVSNVFNLREISKELDKLSHPIDSAIIPPHDVRMTTEKDYIDARLKAMSDSLDQRLETAAAKSDGRLEVIETRMDARVEAIDAKLAAGQASMEQLLARKFAEFDSTLHKSTADTVKWVAGTVLALGVIGISLMTFLLNNVTPKASAAAPAPLIFYGQPTPAATPPAAPATK